MTDLKTCPMPEEVVNPLKSDEYVISILEGAKAGYNAVPEGMRRVTLECYQARELRSSGVLR